MRKSQQRLLKWIITAVMAALCMVLDRFVSYMDSNLKIGISFLPIILVAILCGPIHSMAAWALADLVGSFVFAKGAPIPGITVVYALMGLVYGLFLYFGKLRWWKILLPAAINNFLLALFGTTFFLAQLTGLQTYWPRVGARLLQCTILFGLNLILIPVAYRLGLILRRRMEA